MFFGKRLRRKVFRGTTSLILNLISGIIAILVAIIVFDYHLICNVVKWIKNYVHYRNIDYSYLQIYKLIHRMSGRQFEVFMYEIFKANGFKVKLTDATCDGGKDLILNNDTYVELKRWGGSWEVGRPELQKLVGAAMGDNIENMLFITTGKYNTNAFEYAKKVRNLVLWDMDNVMHLVNKAPVEKLPYIMAKVFKEDSEAILLDKMEQFQSELRKMEG